MDININRTIEATLDERVDPIDYQKNYAYQPMWPPSNNVDYTR